ncbi:hypothetical protein SPRG_11782 [Saprolegnia parasitica CBS 223.65]|uniref:PX domain-containing protein n=1 Tax=Saprolegnia parasitica (strain CBS 223.65) TaxID=695850 RepID=A0A067BXC3_SAPPC|nr:hypothetical protein SPRG_11782 [Saprolegnia parasitica CBS 223.65]KDO22938.1 hypothetical protein SPRG_11782 [Saprolegnia parasitica CBS 223.65]|eukprot:XP_012206374.1 hypothetical protein SPRG_11782 [Saprolegnia parasitica CBS 223.65]
MINKVRTIQSSKRARGSAKKSKKLQQLELLQAVEAATLDELLIVPLVPTTETTSSKTTPSMPMKPSDAHDDEKTDVEEDESDANDDEEDVVVVASPTASSVCTRFLSKSFWSPKDIKAHASDPDATFSVSIPSFRDMDEGYIAYNVVVETPYHTWAVEKRYSEFVLLAQTLQLKEIHMDLPPKTWFKVTQDTVLSDRRERLEAACVDLLQRDNMTSVPLVREFFQLDVFAMSLTDVSP